MVAQQATTVQTTHSYSSLEDISCILPSWTQCSLNLLRGPGNEHANTKDLQKQEVLLATMSAKIDDSEENHLSMTFSWVIRRADRHCHSSKNHV